MLAKLPPAVSIDALRAMRVAPKGGFDVKPAVLFDTVTYVAAGQVSLSFFTQTTADQTLCNLQPAGQLVIGQWFRVARIHLEFLTRVSTGAAVAGRADDVLAIKHAARGQLIYTNNTTQRRDVPVPITYMGAPSDTDVDLNGTQAAGTSLQYGAQRSNGGWPFDEPIMGGETFSFTMNFQGTLVPISADLQIRLSLFGQRYVPVSGS
jgi:hypothetical protein